MFSFLVTQILKLGRQGHHPELIGFQEISLLNCILHMLILKVILVTKGPGTEGTVGTPGRKYSVLFLIGRKPSLKRKFLNWDH